MRFEIRSPINGKVLRVFQESATIVNPGSQLLELGNIADLEIVIDVLSTDAVRVPPGARVSLVHWGGDEPLAARVRLVEPSAFTKISSLGVEEQRVNIVADFDCDPDKRSRLGDGFRVEGRIVVWESDSVLKAPAGALFRQADRWAVFLHRRGKAVMQIVQIGHTDGTETEILEGLSDGDEVIVHPSDKVRHHARVRPRNS
jgi:HlyD family secretion protein